MTENPGNLTEYSPAEVAFFMVQHFAQLLTTKSHRVLGNLGMNTTLYFNRKQQDLPRLVKLVEEFITWVSHDELDWCTDSYSQGMYFLNRDPLAYKSSFEPFFDAKQDFYFALSSDDFCADSPVEVAKDPQKFLLNLSASGEYGFLQVYLPLIWSVNQPDDSSVYRWFYRCCEVLEPIYGKLGFGIQLPYSTCKTDSTDEIVLWDIVRKYPGVEVERPHVRFANAMGSINWINVVHDQLLDKIGGRGSLVKICTEPLFCRDWSHGLIFGAGIDPQLGVEWNSGNLNGYAQLSHLLKDLRTKDIYLNNSLLPRPESNPEKLLEVSKLYLSRFD